MNSTDIVGTTFKVSFVVNILTYNNANAICYANFYSNNKLVLKYKTGGGTGYDGSIAPDATDSRVFYVTMTKADSEKLRQGKLYVEGSVEFEDENYPSGRRVNFKVALKDIDSLNTNV